MQYFSKGRLCAVWRQGDEPQVSDAMVTQLYNEVFVPALQNDVIRMHGVMVGAVRKTRALSYDDYVNALVDFKETIGTMAIPALNPLEEGLDKIHQDYISLKLSGVRRRAVTLARDQEENVLAPNHPDFLDARFRSIAYDTSLAVVDIGEYLCSEKGRADLCIAMLQGGDSVDTLLTGHWIADRRSADMKNLRERLLDCVSSLKLAERVSEIQATRKDKPAQDDIDSAIRVANIKLVAA